MNYIDKYGRWHVKPVTEEKPLPTNNGYIYSFYAQTVGLPVQFTGPILAQLGGIQSNVLTRHPGDNTPPISHDEYVGVAGLDKHWSNSIVNFGEANHFQYCDIEGFKPTQFRKLDINDVLSAYEDLANDPETNTRKAVVKYPALHPIAFWHRPEQQYFYYRCAGRSPGIIRSVYFILATLVSIFKKDKTSPMFGFKMLKLKQLKPTIIEKMLIKLHDRYGNWKEICKNYFPEDHPILERVLNVPH